ncbi:MAG: hypothetical protein ABSE81_00085 [Candidatus Omnitrophota bacterium]
MKNKIYSLFINLRKYLRQIISEEFEIMDSFYYEYTQKNNPIEEGEVYG